VKKRSRVKADYPIGPSLIFLGTRAGCGVPSFYCDCSTCREAVAKPRFQRTRCALLARGASGNILVDASPDLRTQLLREGIDCLDHLLVTHRHYDHTGDLGELEFYVRVRRQEAIPTYMTSVNRDWLHTSFSFMKPNVHHFDTTLPSSPIQHPHFIVKVQLTDKLVLHIISPENAPLKCCIHCLVTKNY